MTDQPAKPRRRWKRWAALGLVLTIGCGAWAVNRESETVRKSRRLRLGMTEADAEAIMGPPARTLPMPMPTRGPVWHSRRRIIADYATPTEDWILNLRVEIRAMLIAAKLKSTDSDFVEWPVTVDFVDDRVKSIERGSEVVER